MTISAELTAQILRFHYVEQWRVGSICRHLNVHHDAVHRVLAQAGVPRAKRFSRSTRIDPYLTFVQVRKITCLRVNHC